MRLQARVPRFATSTVEVEAQSNRPVLDGSDVTIPNRWKLPPNTVALIGRPAVWTALDIALPAIPLGFTTIPAKRLRWEQDFGGHLFLVVTGDDTENVWVVEGGPIKPNGTGNLVPFDYPESDFAERGIVDFDPITISPPNGLSAKSFVALVRDAQRAYDGDQRYLAIEVPFLRVGRDSNSYAIGILLSCGVDPRAIPKPRGEMRWEWTGYPGAEDPVHHANFGAYLGAPTRLADGSLEVAYHAADGAVRLVVVGGAPNGTARLPDGTDVRLDGLGRIVFAPDDANAHGLPSRHTAPPQQIAARRFFPSDPAPQGAQITLVVDGESAPLAPGTNYRGTIVDRHDALGIATLRTEDRRDVVLPLAELGVELRDPKRVDALFRVGTELTVGLRRDRHPKLAAHGNAWAQDRFGWHRFHAPRPSEIVGGTALGIGLGIVALAGVTWYVRRAE